MRLPFLWASKLLDDTITIRYSIPKKKENRNWVERKALSMRKTFYHFLMKYRHPAPKDAISSFANNAFLDHGFPKTSYDYHEISNYLELNGQYLDSMTVFDDAWQEYLISES